MESSSSPLSSIPSPTSLGRLNDASEWAVELVNRIASTEPPPQQDGEKEEADKHSIYSATTGNNENGNNPWKNPQSIQEELILSRNALAEAWNGLQKEQQEQHRSDEKETETNDYDNNDKNDENDEISEEEFRVLYIDMITDAFGDVLEQMQKEGRNNSNTTVDVEILGDCLQSGMELLDLDQRNRKSFFGSLESSEIFGNDDDKMKDKDGNDVVPNLMVHAKRQRSLGYLLLTGGGRAEGVAKA